jgi:hypothetical protein
METLAELVNVVNRKRLSKVDILDRTFLSKKSNKLYYKFYTAIEQKLIVTDEQASKFIYNSNKDDHRYRMLKSRFKSKLLKTLILLNSEDAFYDETNKKIYYECLIDYLTIETLIKLTGTNTLVYKLIKENYAKAQKYNYYDILKNYSYYLMLYYSLKGDNRAFNAEEDRYSKYSKFATEELAGKIIYHKIIINFASGVPITKLLIESIKTQIDDLHKIKSKLNNAEISFYYFYSLLLYYEHVGNLELLLETCNMAEKLLIDQPYIVTTTRRVAILLYRIKGFLHSRNYVLGMTLLNDSNISLPESSYNWFVLKEFEFKLYLQDNKIEDATRIYQKVIKNKLFKRQVEQLTEKWKIFYAYLVFMDSYVNNGNFKFSLSKFLNDVPVNSKDKSGFNFAIRLVEMLYMFGRKEYNIVFQKMEALRVYRTRYLSDNTYKRNHLLLGALLKAEKLGFNGREMQKVDWHELQELRKQNNHIIADWEIVPYEQVWDIICDLAKKPYIV